MHLRERLDRSNDGQDHTVLPYAHSPTATGFSRAVDVAGKMLARRAFSAAHPHAVSGSQGLPALPAPCRADAAASTAARLAKRDDTRSPLKVKPGWATHTTNPNFGKVEYFCRGGLTALRVFCPSGKRGCLHLVIASAATCPPKL
ncbi:blr6887 [Bradyrhizobium diazoefficiens USDA 110]|uniref:Blr6887 protein n=1 Tax=Bradyrhizobium diazoefficiens (strain JCM 10833 / BCRC 13528 / IAM 13628 / NBRC 14792 / USDA 110) TaxID=224911 RepID=Q89F14_BRADU|nr:hypothetical protein CO678_12635 [Bradyrhizobium diazoefficiens]QBP25628.1 hypothetical protein Bdiaspc4_36315 [Bradyrhizobium diazoefficiens]BAC52152.1 blr6887 [Bradyrhizobium diazoefficiens USDA 110]